MIKINKDVVDISKLDRLKQILTVMDSAVLAYSGGVDSAFLLKIAHGVMGDKLLAVTGVSPSYPKQEQNSSKELTSELGVRHVFVDTLEMDDKNYSSNPVNRCYFCKKELFSKLKEVASAYNIPYVMDASNFDDLDDFRPGTKAKKEYGVRSPLEEAEFTKDDVRQASRKVSLQTWNKPATACLASRVPHATEISEEILNRINLAELYLRKLGFFDVRVRCYEKMCRIEVNKEDIHKIFEHSDAVIKEFKSIGFSCISVDLEGYRMGSINGASHIID